MSNSSEIGDAGRFSSFRPARLPDKSSTFSQTCSLLSQYLKEKKTVTATFGDLALAINNTTNSDSHGMFRQSAATTMDLFPQQSGFAPKSADVREKSATINNSQQQQEEEDGRGGQMTIFYNGQVIVLNDFPADKAKQVMALATKESASSSLPPPPPPVQKPIVGQATTTAFTNRNPTDLVVPRPAPQSPVTAIPIARKASLTRFLEKRKDRITTRAPYPLQKPAETKASPPSWLGLGAQYPPLQFGHRL